MSVKLTRTDVAALDLLIASLEEEQRGAAVETVEVAAIPAAVVAATARATPAVVRATPAVIRATRLATELIGGAVAVSDELAASARELPAELSLEQLKELRAQIDY